MELMDGDLSIQHLQNEKSDLSNSCDAFREQVVCYLRGGDENDARLARTKMTRHDVDNSIEDCLDRFYVLLYNEEIYNHLESHFCPVLNSLFEKLEGLSQAILARKYVDSLEITHRHYGLYIKGFEIIFSDGQDVSTEHYSFNVISNLKRYLWKVFYADNELIWTYLAHTFFSLYLSNNEELDSDLKLVLKYTRILGVRSEMLKTIMEIIVGILHEQILAHKNVHNRPSLDECLNSIRNKSIIRLSEELKFEHIDYRRMEKIMLDKFHEMRCEELFDIVKAFTAGENVQCAIEDMKKCIINPKHRDNMKKCFIRDFKSRLLHSSVGTSGIIIYLISLKIVLDTIDPTSYVLNAVVKPVRDYLRWRKDLNKCVLQIILSKETHMVGINRERPDEEAESIAELDTWVPDSIDAIGTPQERRSDTIEFLVKLLESPSKLFNEYANHMASMLLNKKSMNTNDECIELELLMNQFGESNFINCRVMLMDVSTSLCLSTSYADEHKKKLPSNIKITPVIFSYYSWPLLDNMPINLPKQFRLSRDSFDQWHSHERSNKYLVWLFGNGVVELDIDIGGTVLSFRVPELDALVISLFDDNYEDMQLKHVIDLLIVKNDDIPKLSRQNNISYQQLSQRIHTSLNEWVSRRVLLYKAFDVYSAKKTYNDQCQIPQPLDEYSILSADVNSSIDDVVIKPLHETVDTYNIADTFQNENTLPQEEELYKSMIIGMLSNQGPTTIEQIHSRMCMFIGYSKPIPILRAFLNKLHLNGAISRNADEAYYI